MSRLQLLFGIGLGFAVGTLAINSQRLFEDSINNSFGKKVSTIVNTRYQQIVTTTFDDNYCLFLNRIVQFCSMDEAKYHNALVEPVLSTTQAKRILILGGGDGLALKKVREFNQTADVVQVELDEKMIEFAKKDSKLTQLNQNVYANVMPIRFEDFVKNPKFGSTTLLIGDADVVLNHPSVLGQFDAIIVDYPDPTDLSLAKLYSVQHFRKVQKVLSANGRIAIQSSSYQQTPIAFASIGKTLKSAGFKTIIPYRAEITSFGGWGFWLAKRNDESEIDLISSTSAKVKSMNFSHSTVFPMVNDASFFDTFRGAVSTVYNPSIMLSYVAEQDKFRTFGKLDSPIKSKGENFSVNYTRNGKTCLKKSGELVICDSDFATLQDSLNLVIGNSNAEIAIFGSEDSVLPNLINTTSKIIHFSSNLELTNGLSKVFFGGEEVGSKTKFVSFKSESNSIDLRNRDVVTRRFLDSQGSQKDVILLDVGSQTIDGNAYFFSKEFYQRTKQTLKKQGRLVIVLQNNTYFGKENQNVLKNVKKHFANTKVYSVPTLYSQEVVFLVASETAIDLGKSSQMPTTTVNLEFMKALEIDL
ncbi:MAG: hypothetical protein ACRCXZ_01460 [Patescibacteria group bacterium]